jgi:hypothetical protein
MDELTLDDLRSAVRLIRGAAKTHKRECGECGDWLTLDDAAEALDRLIWEWEDDQEAAKAEVDPMTLWKRRVEDAHQ